MEESNGDIWAMLEQFLERAIRLCERKQNSEFLRNQLDSGERNTLLLQLCGMAPDICGNSRRRTLQQQIYERCVGVSMRAMSWERFTAFFDLAMTCIGMEIARFFDGIPLDEVREHFRAREEVLRCGVNLFKAAGCGGKERLEMRMTGWRRAALILGVCLAAETAFPAAVYAAAVPDSGREAQADTPAAGPALGEGLPQAQEERPTAKRSWRIRCSHTARSAGASKIIIRRTAI